MMHFSDNIRVADAGYDAPELQLDTFESKVMIVLQETGGNLRDAVATVLNTDGFSHSEEQIGALELYLQQGYAAKRSSQKIAA